MPVSRKTNKYFTLPQVVRFGALLCVACLCGCSTTTRMAAHTYEKTPEYTLVETRFSSNVFLSDLSPTELIELLQQDLQNERYAVQIKFGDDQSIKISFLGTFAKGSIKLLAKTIKPESLYRYKYTSRVKIVQFPATIEQDAEVNRMAELLAERIRDLTLSP